MGEFADEFDRYCLHGSGSIRQNTFAGGSFHRPLDRWNYRGRWWRTRIFAADSFAVPFHFVVGRQRIYGARGVPGGSLDARGGIAR